MSYEAYFTDAEGYFAGASFAKEAVMFGLQVIGDERDAVVGLDARIGATIAAILEAWLADHPAGVICYVCNPSDKRPHQRALRFDRMFREGNTAGTYSKVDVNRPPLYASALLRSGNPAKQEIEQAVRELVEKFD